MSQIAIDWTPPRVKDLVRRTDPDTSREAAREHLRSGKLTKNEILAYGAVCRQEGLTYRELHRELAGAIAEPQEVLRRLADLAPRDRLSGEEIADACLVRRGPKRKCTVGGRPCETWWLPASIAKLNAGAAA